MEKNDFVQVPSLGNGIYQIESINGDDVVIKYTRDVKISLKKCNILRKMNTGIFKTQAV